MIKELKQKVVKDAIVAETRKQFLEKGIQKTTLRGIAKELDIAFGNIYYYYKSKMDICDILWVEYTNGFLDFFEESMSQLRMNGIEQLRFYYDNLFKYYEENLLYVELISFSMSEKPRHLRASKENQELVRTTLNRLHNTLKAIYNKGINDGSIKSQIHNVFYESWSFNIAFTAIVINIVLYHEIEIEIYEYYVKTYIERLSKMGGKNEVEFKT